LGIVPFHFWLPKLVASLQTKEILLLLVWQKIGPLFLIILIPSLQRYLKIFICILSVGVGRVLGIKQTQWRQIFTFSSISHLGWIVIRRIVSFWLFIIYFVVYAISLIQVFIFRNSQFLNSSIYSFSSFNILNLFILLSLAGLPPILGFMTKIIVLLYLLNSQFITLILFFLITFSIIRIFFYLKIFFTLTLSLNRFEINRGKRLILRNLIIFLSFPLILNFYKL
jgi:NADH:ubiquinone oxidoreductase subunit 2 (subunit N)